MAKFESLCVQNQMNDNKEDVYKKNLVLCQGPNLSAEKINYPVHTLSNGRDSYNIALIWTPDSDVVERCKWYQC
eukprot:13018252-Ditylum_brightwellii.AAC.1